MDWDGKVVGKDSRFNRLRYMNVNRSGKMSERDTDWLYIADNVIMKNPHFVCYSLYCL